MKTVTVQFRPMPNLAASHEELSVTTYGAFVCVDAIVGHPIFLAPHAALAMSNALREAYNEAREAGREVLR